MEPCGAAHQKPLAGKIGPLQKIELFLPGEWNIQREPPKSVKKQKGELILKKPEVSEPQNPRTTTRVMFDSSLAGTWKPLLVYVRLRSVFGQRPKPPAPKAGRLRERELERPQENPSATFLSAFGNPQNGSVPTPGLRVLLLWSTTLLQVPCISSGRKSDEWKSTNPNCGLKTTNYTWVPCESHGKDNAICAMVGPAS